MLGLLFLVAYTDDPCATLLTMIITNITFFADIVLVIINKDFDGRHSSIPNGEEDMRKYGKVKISSNFF